MLDRFRESLKGAGTYMYPADHETKYDFYKAVEEMMEVLTKNMISKYVKKDEKNEARVVRPSVIGKLHTFDLLYSKLVGLDKSRFNSERLALIFSLGYFIEAWVIMTFKRMGYEVEEDVSVEMGGLTGHIDCIITDDDGQRYAVEIKSASSNYFNRVVKFGVDDSRGYLTQASCYRYMTGLPLIWLFINKDTCDMLLIPIDEAVPIEDAKAKFYQALNVTQHYDEVKNISDVYFYAGFPPPPAIEKDRFGEYKKDDEGKFRMYIPSDVLYPDVYYYTQEGKTSYGKKREYVIGMKLGNGTDLFGDELFSYARDCDIVKTQAEVALADYFQHWMKS